MTLCSGSDPQSDRAFDVSQLQVVNDQTWLRGAADVEHCVGPLHYSS